MSIQMSNQYKKIIQVFVKSSINPNKENEKRKTNSKTKSAGYGSKSPIASSEPCHSLDVIRSGNVNVNWAMLHLSIASAKFLLRWAKPSCILR